MSFGDKLAKLRREKNYTQEQLAELLGVSRQAVGKWESGTAYPETEKLIRLSELFDCTLDYLMKDGQQQTAADTSAAAARADTAALPWWIGRWTVSIPERKSQKTLWGQPLWAIGKEPRGIVAVGLNARGVIAVGAKATGVVAFGLLSMGVLSFGMLSVGLLSFGLFALGLCAAGCFSAGLLAAGAISFGVVSLGAVAVGEFSAGALAVGHYAAVGDHARAMIALGDTQAAGSLYQHIGTLDAADAAEVKRLLSQAVPSCLTWARELFAAFLR